MTVNSKYAVLSIWLFVACGNLFAQNDSNKFQNCDSIVSHIATLVEDADMRIYQHESTNRYKLYPTENI